MNCEQAKKINLIQYLDYLKIFPKKINREEYYYLSPLRNETNPSFHVDSVNNIWFDHGGDNSGGTIIDFGIQYHHCTISEFLKILEDYVHSNKLPNSIQQAVNLPAKTKMKEKKIIVTSTGLIESPPLICYLQLRKIPEKLAQTFCCEAKYKLYDKFYYAIGFKNNDGGYELRNPGFKGSSKPKGITFIDRNFRTIEVFEGFFSFLSFLTVIKNWEFLHSNFLILNSLSFFWKCQELMEMHDLINLHLDRDTQGFLRTKEVQKISDKYKDASMAYYGFKDWNHYLCNRTGLSFCSLQEVSSFNGLIRLNINPP